MERADAVGTAARAGILTAFTAGQGYAADADYSVRAWLIHKAKVTRGAAAGHIAWMRRAVTHPLVIAALTEGALTESMARVICRWTGRLPRNCVDTADEILVTAAGAGAEEADIAALAAEMYARSQPGERAERLKDGAIRLETTFEGAGVLTGDLTAECAAVVTSVLDALSAPAGAEDDRTHEQRYHDALEEAMRRLVSAGLLPERAGQPVKALVHVSLAELRVLDEDSGLEGEWITLVRAQWAAARATASVTGSDGAAWLDGDAARGICCDASMTPVVTGEIDTSALDGLVTLCVELAGLGPAARGVTCGCTCGGCTCPAPAPPSGQAREALERAVIGKAVDLLSGPGGLASFLRTRQLGARLAGPSLPLDIGYSTTIPPGIRSAVMLRDKRCRWPGGCSQPAVACQVHHVRHLADGGPTSVGSCLLLCFFHHNVVIHRWGWTITLNPDGTTTAWNPRKTKVLHSHGPPP
jgi:hypothetical protein